MTSIEPPATLFSRMVVAHDEKLHCSSDEGGWNHGVPVGVLLAAEPRQV
jgi:hypothetical protein